MAGGEVWNDDSNEALTVLNEVDMAVARLPEKLTNLENLLALVLSGESDIKVADDVEDGNVSADFIEKASSFHLLFAILILELKELDGYLSELQDGITETLRRTSSYAVLQEGGTDKLRDSKDLLRRWQERVLQMNIQLAKMEMTSFLFRHNEQEFNWSMRVERELQLASTERTLEVVAGERRHSLRMLEISLLREMELEKQLSELKQSEEDLRLKISLKEQVSSGMEEAAEIAWTRFLEADNAAEIWMGISKEILNKVLSARKATESATEFREQAAPLDAEVIGLKERTKMLEVKLEEEKAFSKNNKLQLKRMGDEIALLRESSFAAESRAEVAEEKATQLTESNLELTEELDFLKGSNDSLEKKASMFQKQVTELDIELQHAKASSEANQEQQNMLYSAIFDMETLIDELKQKVSKSELNAESAEERCLILSETNSELSKELDFLRSRVECTPEKGYNVQELHRRSAIIMDMVVQLAIERERIHDKLTSVTKENKLLRESLLKQPKKTAAVSRPNKKQDEYKEVMPSVIASEISSKSSEVQKTENDVDSSDKSGEGFSSSPITELGGPDYTGSSVGRKRSPSRYTYIAIVVLLLSILAAGLLYEMIETVD